MRNKTRWGHFPCYQIIILIFLLQGAIFSCPYFLAFGANTEIYCLNLRIQSKCWTISTRKIMDFGYFSLIDKHARFYLVSKFHILSESRIYWQDNVLHAWVFYKVFIKTRATGKIYEKNSNFNVKFLFSISIF